MYTVAIVGASGYAGAELIRLVHGHPELSLRTISAGSNAGSKLSQVHPQFAAVSDLADLVLGVTDASHLQGHDLIFMALPHGESAAIAATLGPSARVVDLGADYRLSDPEAWKRYYGGAHAGQWVYGLPELPSQREQISISHRVANPGCYATAIQLGLAPLLVDDLVEHRDIIVVAASGTSGAGRSAKVHLLASEVAGSMSTYKVGGTHQHTAEVEQQLSEITGEAVSINFTPMLAPMSRGILATMSVRTQATLSDLRHSLEAAYEAETFVQVLSPDQLPVTAATYGSNAAHIQVALDERTGRATVFTALDNLVKGAAGQAVQNANIILGLPESSGLSAIGVAP
jgi:N-acetyl-gamma-glutamyl-phosphate reductase